MTLDGANLGSDYCRRSGAVVSLLHFQVLDARRSRLPDARVARAYGFDQPALNTSMASCHRLTPIWEGCGHYRLCSKNGKFHGLE
jgi:hypothetical protein